MSEKNVYVFGTQWGDSGSSFFDLCISKKIAFINNVKDGDTDYRITAKQIKKGDILALKDGSKLGAIGIAKIDADIQHIFNFFQTNDLVKYEIDNDVEIIYSIVDEWHKLNSHDKENIVFSGRRFRLAKMYGDIYDNAYNKIYELYTRLNLEQKMKEKELIYSTEQILTNNHNLILTGVPGTGKTYLAKQIAAKMIFGEDITLKDIEKDEDKKAKFEYQYKFVQFHPSYDYTDFVEGIRPITKEDNSYGFVRKDGTFKEFCIRAAKNIIDSQKTVDELSNEKVILKYLDEYAKFILEQLDENDKYYIGDSNETLNLYMNDFKQDNKGILFSFENNQNKVRMYFEEIIDMYNFYSDVMKNKKDFLIKDFLEYTERKSRHATFYYRFIRDLYNKFSEKIEKDIENKFVKTVKQEKFIFVIDEINRGDINKILGELFYAIDTGYRGEKGMVDTQYQNLVESDDIFSKGFYIPENVYIIGTMNDIDRSVESIDFAIRRRFAWKEIAPEETAEDILKAVKVDGSYNIFKALNNFIASAEGLGKMYQIGASYFLKLNSYVDNNNVTAEEAYKKLWDNHLKGLFFEYVRGKKNADEIFSNIETTYFNAVNEILAN